MVVLLSAPSIWKGDASLSLSKDRLTRRQKGVLRMTQHHSFALPASPLDLQLTQGKLSRRTFLGKMVGLTLTVQVWQAQ
jgi:hypothetical protein